MAIWILSGTTRVSRYQKGKNNLDFTEARDSEWQWHQLGYMQICISPQTDNHTSNPPLKSFTGQMPFLPPNQQHQSTESKANCKSSVVIYNLHNSNNTSSKTLETTGMGYALEVIKGVNVTNLVF